MSHQCTHAVMETRCILGFTGKIVASRSGEEMVSLKLAFMGLYLEHCAQFLGSPLQQRHGQMGPTKMVRGLESVAGDKRLRAPSAWRCES